MSGTAALNCPRSTGLPLTCGEIVGHDEGTAADEDEVIRCGLGQGGGHCVGHGSESVANEAMTLSVAL